MESRTPQHRSPPALAPRGPQAGRGCLYQGHGRAYRRNYSHREPLAGSGQYREAIEIARDGGDEVRELVIEIPDSAVSNLFKVPTVAGKAVSA